TYIAFSHKWGDMPEKAKTKPANEQRRLTGSIRPAELPPSFKDVIAVTRALGCRYLWIDCICIVQGPDGDFDEQTDTMQDTFSNAYCVIAAADAESANSGFLKEREGRSCQIGNLHLSSVTNDFERDVLQNPLSRRGWVLQEHALVRRTIFFTKTQTYWECGEGVRCE
ncbi:heterokaryon incompatibility, partial [Setomelanomma holmii]